MIRVLIAFLLLASAVGLAADTPKELRAYFEKTCDSKKFMVPLR
jgi:hypothetical protein